MYFPFCICLAIIGHWSRGKILWILLVIQLSNNSLNKWRKKRVFHWFLPSCALIQTANKQLTSIKTEPVILYTISFIHYFEFASSFPNTFSLPKLQSFDVVDRSNETSRALRRFLSASLNPLEILFFFAFLCFSLYRGHKVT